MSALTGSPLKMTIMVFDLFPKLKKYDIKKKDFFKNYLTLATKNISVQNYKNKILLGKTSLQLKYLISDHAFSFLGISQTMLNKISYTFVKLYNPMGTDIPVNLIDPETSKLLPLFIAQITNTKVKKAEKFFDANDGIFYLTYNDILNYFAKITCYEPSLIHEIFSKELILEGEIETNFSIVFEQKIYNKNSQRVFFFFNLLKNELLSNQTQPFEVKNLQISPIPPKFESLLDGKSKKYIDLTYQGCLFVQNLSNTTYTLNFTIKKYNYDVMDKIYLAFFAPLNSIKFLKVSKKPSNSNLCPNKCSSHGICNILNKTCMCYRTVE